VLYTTTIANNLSSNQDLAGTLSLALPPGYSGAPLAADVNVASGDSESLVSTLTIDGAQPSGSHVLSSTMNLVDFYDPVWTWDPATTTSTPANQFGAVGDVAAIALKAPSFAYLVISREIADDGTEALVARTLKADGGTVLVSTIYTARTGVTLTPPAILRILHVVECPRHGRTAQARPGCRRHLLRTVHDTGPGAGTHFRRA
jgi:hypothetical protein